MSIFRPFIATFLSATVASALSDVIAAAGPEDEPVHQLPDLHVPGRVPLVREGFLYLREPRFAPAAVAHGDYIYVIGGGNESDFALRSIERLHVSTGKSEEFARLRIGRCWHQAVLVGDQIYVIGGDQRIFGGPRRNLTTSVEIIDLPTRKVLPGPSLPEARMQFGCVVLDRKIYVIGGTRVRNNAHTTTNTVYVLDLAKGQWSQGDPMPTARLCEAAVVDGGFIIVPGGYTGRYKVDVVEVYNPRERTWLTVEPLVRPRSAQSLAFIGQHLFMFGDYDNPDELMVYDLLNRSSEIFTLGYKAARHTAVAVHGDRLFVVGGKEEKSSPALDYVQIYKAVSLPARAKTNSGTSSPDR